MAKKFEAYENMIRTDCWTNLLGIEHMAAGYHDRTSKVIESKASEFTSQGNRDESISNDVQDSLTNVSHYVFDLC